MENQGVECRELEIEEICHQVQESIQGVDYRELEIEEICQQVQESIQGVDCGELVTEETISSMSSLSRVSNNLLTTSD